MNPIDIIESHRIQLGLSEEEFVEKSNHMTLQSYIRYRNKERTPEYESFVQYLDTVGLKFAVVQKNMKGIEVEKWGILDLYIQLNKGMVFDSFFKETGIMLSRTNENFNLLRSCALYLWFYKTNKIAIEKTYFTVNGLKGVVENMEEIGLISGEKPGENAYLFYNALVVNLEVYLREANLITEL